MTIVIRRMRFEDARSFLEVHRAAVRGIATRDYPPAVIEAWAPLPITDKVVEKFLANPENELRLVAEVAGEIVGIGAIVLEKAELRACYVMPKMARKGVGSALVREIERIANENNLTHLEMDASVNSEPFYTALAFEIENRGEHILRSGERMACVKMRKVLDRAVPPLIANRFHAPLEAIPTERPIITLQTSPLLSRRFNKILPRNW